MAQTIIDTDVIWEGDTIFIYEDVLVDREGTLTISRGTTLLFDEAVVINVEGQIYVDGTADSTVIFSGIDSVGWGGLKLLRGVDSAKINYAAFYYADTENGALYVNKSYVEVNHCVFMFNKGINGSAIYVAGGQDFDLRYTLIANNESENGTVYVDYGYYLTLFNVTIANNRSNGVGGIYTTTQLDIFNSILALNDSSNLYFDKEPNQIPIIPRFSLIEEGYIGNSVISGDPMFVDVEGNNFKLSLSSTAIDQGCHCYLDPDGTRSDMGYEPINQDFQDSHGYTIVDSTSILDTTWNAQNGPYLVCSNITIKTNEVLVINENVEVLFPLNREINVEGELIMDTSKDNPIIFSGTDSTQYSIENDEYLTQTGWGGIHYMNGKENYLEYVIFSGLGQQFYHYPSNFESTTITHLRASNGSGITFNECEFRNNFVSKGYSPIEPNTMIYSEPGSRIEISGCDFIQNKALKTSSSLIFSDESHLTILKSRFILNEGFHLISFDYAFNQNKGYNLTIDSCFFIQNNLTDYPASVIVKYRAPQSNSIARISYNTFKNNYGGLELSGETEIINNLFIKNSRSDINYSFGKHSFIGNLLSKNHDFVFNIEYAALNMFNNTISSNTCADKQLMDINYQSSVEVYNNIFYNNSPKNFSDTQIGWIENETIGFKNNMVNETIDEYNYLIDGFNNSYNPGFVSIETDDYNLTPNSAAIDKAYSEGIEDYLPPYDLFGNDRIDKTNNQLDIGAVEFDGVVSHLRYINLSDTVIMNTSTAGSFVANIITSEFEVVTYQLINEFGLNNDYFKIEDNQLILTRDINSEEILRIKILAQDEKGASFERYFYLYITEPLAVSKRNNTIIYPVPSNNYLKTKVPCSNCFAIDIKGTHLPIKSIDNTTIDIRNLAQGVFLLSCEEFTKPIKFIKE